MPDPYADAEDARIAREWALDDVHLPHLTRQPIEPPHNVPTDFDNPPGWRSTDHGPVTFRRWCETCREFTPPRDGQHAPSARDFLAMYHDPDSACLNEPAIPVLCMVCSKCKTMWPGPRMLAGWRYTEPDDFLPDQVVLRLAVGQWRATDRIDVDELPVPGALDRHWEKMIRGLLDKLTYTQTCAADGCAETARTRFAVNRPCLIRALPGVRRPGDSLFVCPRHEAEILHDPDLLWRYPR